LERLGTHRARKEHGMETLIKSKQKHTPFSNLTYGRWGVESRVLLFITFHPSLGNEWYEMKQIVEGFKKYVPSLYRQYWKKEKRWVFEPEGVKGALQSIYQIRPGELNIILKDEHRLKFDREMRLCRTLEDRRIQTIKTYSNIAHFNLPVPPT
jgi:hypothetical protein